MEGCQSLRLLLTNTKVPRSTSALVAGVGAKKTKYPAVVDPMLDAIDGISLQCVQVFKQLQAGEMDTHQVTSELEVKETSILIGITYSQRNTVGIGGYESLLVTWSWCESS